MTLQEQIQEQTREVQAFMVQALLAHPHPSFYSWARAWQAGKRTQTQAGLVFMRAKDNDDFWAKYPEAQKAFTAARVLSDLLEEKAKADAKNKSAEEEE